MTEVQNRHWTLDDIPWERFDRTKVDPEMLRIVKAAAMVEYNGDTYADYLCNVFGDDPEFQDAARRWSLEEVQHGEALSRWAEIADPGFDFEARFADFSQKIQLPVAAEESVRGTRCGELVARCMVEVGTSSYYTALHEATDEPVLREICRRIAQDEIRHYKLFFTHMERYRTIEGLGKIKRLLVGLGRIGESEDDELAYAYYAANNHGEPYNRKRCIRAYMSRTYGFYETHHVERAVTLVLKAVGFTPHGRLSNWIARATCWFMNLRAGRNDPVSV
ncbi:MAG: rubrerythrin family protein [Rhodospirillaceae bacterium]|nr:rubrerythrin family protein [Rhodospirillaceae bacterium]|tara:strand:- start:1029 stop:1859 length:831 start_codon:yes stop_codon:yes gene_type:complete